MSWQILEVLKIAVLIGLALGLHRFIRRFGGRYASDIFRSTPDIGKNFLILADVGYYLIFTAYTLFNVRFEKAGSWSEQVNAAQLQSSLASVAGICLIIGVLHGFNVFALPVLASILALKEKLLEQHGG